MLKHTTGHRKRLRDRFTGNPAAVQDYEILELLLGTVILRRDTKPLAKELLFRFQTLRGVLEAKEPELLAVPGFGPSLASYWRLLRELIARYLESPLRSRMQLATPDAVAFAARRRFAGLSHEEFWIALLDTQNYLLGWEQLSRGGIDRVTMDPRTVMEQALKYKASGIILVHNHPGGNPSPSGMDLTLTRNIMAAASALGIRLLDHVIVTDSACYSLEQDGLLPEVNKGP